MTREAFQRGDWEAVIAAHPLESHDPEEWLRYGVALLQTLTPGPDVGKQQQQAALAFLQAGQEGASSEQIREAQHASVILCLQQALESAGIAEQCQPLGLLGTEVKRKALKKPKTLLILVHTCTQYEDARCRHVLDTWASQEYSNIAIAFATDNQSSALPGALYMGPYKSGPTYHPETTVKILEYFEGLKDDFDWFMMVDDDTYLVVENLLAFLSAVDERKSYLVADFINWPVLYENWREVARSCLQEEPPMNFDYKVWPSGGPGLVFSRSGVAAMLSMIRELQAMEDPVLRPINHDVWLHRIIEKQGQSRIARLHCPGFHQFGDESLLSEFMRRPARFSSIHLNHKMKLMEEFHRHRPSLCE